MQKSFNKSLREDEFQPEIFRCDIVASWTAEEMAQFILDLKDFYSLGFVLNLLREEGHVRKSLTPISWDKLSDYLLPAEKLKLNRIEYGSPGVIEVYGAVVGIAPLAAVIIAAIDTYLKHRKKAKLGIEKDFLEIIKDYITIAKEAGMTALEIREMLNYLLEKEENLNHLFVGGKIAVAFRFPIPNDQMVEIPEGEFIYGEDSELMEIKEPFYIDIYPITNKQYKKFIEADGYSNNDFWNEEGVQWREKSEIKFPAYWNQKKWNQPEHPVVGVSFYEAEAYAKWADKRLPTEIEWERAARGTDGRKHPWGNEFDDNKCNTAESYIGKTTPVTRYPNGKSPDGCYDMVGNTWEWTSSLYNKNFKMISGSNRVLRGGGWYNGARICRSAIRGSLRPDARSFNVGFRLVRSVALGP